MATATKSSKTVSMTTSSGGVAISGGSAGISGGSVGISGGSVGISGGSVGISGGSSSGLHVSGGSSGVHVSGGSSGGLHVSGGSSGAIHASSGGFHSSSGAIHSSSSHHGGSASYSVEITHEDNSQLIKDLWIFHDDVTLGLKRIIETITSRDKIVVRLMREAKEREHAILEWKKKWESANHLVMERQAKIHELEERIRKLMIEYQQIEHLKAALAALQHELEGERKRWHAHIEELKVTIHKRDVYIEELRKNQCTDECKRLRARIQCLEENISSATKSLSRDCSRVTY